MSKKMFSNSRHQLVTHSLLPLAVKAGKFPTAPSGLQGIGVRNYTAHAPQNVWLGTFFANASNSQ